MLLLELLLELLLGLCMWPSWLVAGEAQYALWVDQDVWGQQLLLLLLQPLLLLLVLGSALLMMHHLSLLLLPHCRSLLWHLYSLLLQLLHLCWLLQAQGPAQPDKLCQGVHGLCHFLQSYRLMWGCQQQLQGCWRTPTAQQLPQQHLHSRCCCCCCCC